MQVHPAPQKRPQFLLNRDEPESDQAPRDELDQQINVTLWAELPARCRAEQGKTRDTVSAAELSKPFAVNGPSTPLICLVRLYAGAVYSMERGSRWDGRSHPTSAC